MRLLLCLWRLTGRVTTEGFDFLRSRLVTTFTQGVESSSGSLSNEEMEMSLSLTLLVFGPFCQQEEDVGF